ncbi:MAG: aromatic hydrocarbon degradation protein [Acinetobacter sp.]|nr:aromatic hydrocarbon degradation protein [Acinetobacter sp.]
MNKQNILRATAAAFVFLPAFSFAAMGTVATNFGLLPQDVATAQSLSLFSNQPSAVYYNPAYLARDRKGQVSAAYLFTDQDIRAKGWGTPDKIIKDGDVIEDRSNYNVLLGFKTDLSTMLKSNRAMVLGLMLGAERSGERLLSFSAQTSQTAQSFRYGQQSLFLSAGVGLNVVPGFDVGAAARITLDASANLDAVARITDGSDGKSSLEQEQLLLTAKPSIQPILSGTINWGELVCPKNDCWLSGLETAAAWRYESAIKTGIGGNAFLGAAPALPLVLKAIDGYSPETFTAGIHYNLYKARFGVTAEYQLWSGLEDNLRRSTITDQANLKFNDVLIPRVGMEYRLNKEFSFLFGVSYEESPLRSSESLDINFVDSDRLVFGAGFSYLIEKALFLSQPVRVDFAYQYHHLFDRDFRLSTTRNLNETGTNCGAEMGTKRCEDVTTNGGAHVVNASINLTF